MEEVKLEIHDYKAEMRQLDDFCKSVSQTINHVEIQNRQLESKVESHRNQQQILDKAQEEVEEERAKFLEIRETNERLVKERNAIEAECIYLTNQNETIE